MCKMFLLIPVAAWPNYAAMMPIGTPRIARAACMSHKNGIKRLAQHWS